MLLKPIVEILTTAQPEYFAPVTRWMSQLPHLKLRPDVLAHWIGAEFSETMQADIFNCLLAADDCGTISQEDSESADLLCKAMHNCNPLITVIATGTEQAAALVTIRTALEAAQTVIENTYGHDADGERDDDEAPDYSGADIVEQLCNLEQTLADAFTALETLQVL